MSSDSKPNDAKSLESASLSETTKSSEINEGSNHSSQDSGKSSTFRGPKCGAIKYTLKDLEKIKVTLQIKKPKPVLMPPATITIDPSAIVPVRKKDEGKVPLFSKIPFVNECFESQTPSTSQDNAKVDESSKPRSEKEKSKSRERSKSSRSRRSTRSRSKSRSPSYRRSYKKRDAHFDRAENIRLRKLELKKERELQRKDFRSRRSTRSRSSSSVSSEDRRSRSRSSSSSRSRKRSRSRSSSRHSRTRSRSRSQHKDRRRRDKSDRHSVDHHVLRMREGYGAPWPPYRMQMERPPFPYVPPLPPFYPPVMYPHPPFRPFRPHLRTPSRGGFRRL